MLTVLHYRHQKEGRDMKRRLLRASLLELLSQTKFWMAWAVGISLTLLPTYRFSSYLSAIGGKMQLLECYTIISSTASYFSGIVIGMILIVSDAPFISERTITEMIRCGKKAWYATKVQTTAIVIFFYLLSVLAASFIIPMCCGLDVSLDNAWSSSMMMLVRNPSTFVATFKLYFPYDECMQTTLPYALGTLAFALNYLYLLTLGLVAFAFNMIGNRAYGVAAAILWHLVGYIIYANGPMYFPQQLSLLSSSMAVLQYTSVYQLNVWNSLVIFSFVIVALLTFIRLLSISNRCLER